MTRSVESETSPVGWGSAGILEKKREDATSVVGEPEEPSFLARLQQGLPRCFGNGPVQRDSAGLGLGCKDQ